MKWMLLLSLIVLNGCGAPDRWYREREPEVARIASEPSRVETAAEPEPAGPQVQRNDAGAVVVAIEDAVVLALAHNRDLQVRAYDPEISASFIELERGRWDPELYGQLRAGAESASEVDRGTGQQFTVDSDSASVSAGLRQEFPTGTTVDLGIEQDRDNSDRTPTQHETRVGLSVTQALLRGYGPAVNLAAIHRAQLAAAASRFELRAYTEALVARTELAYWAVVRAERGIEIARESLLVAERQRDDLTAQIEVGTMPRSAAAATHSELARREQLLVAAEAERERSRLRLLRACGLDLAAEIELTTPVDQSTFSIDDLDERLALAQRQRPELGEARLRLEQNRLDVVVSEDGLLPRLDFFVDLGKTGFGSSSGRSLEALDEDTWDVTLGLDLSWSLGERSARARNARSLATRAQAQAALVNLSELIDYEVRLAASEVESARRQLAAAANTVGLQRETLRAEQERLAVGTSTPLQVAQAQRDLIAAQVAEVEAAIAWRSALVELYLAEGSLLERRGMAVE